MLELLLSGDLSLKEILDYYNIEIIYMALPKVISSFYFEYKGINNIFINQKLPVLQKNNELMYNLLYIELYLKQSKKPFNFHFKGLDDDISIYLQQIKKETTR